MGSVSDGTDSTTPLVKPSKPFLLYATLSINETPFRTLLDTGASATCISSDALARISNSRYLDTTARAFTLADGILPLQITGSVELSLNIGSQHIPFCTFVTEKLCVDLIPGMDIFLAFHALIDVQLQQFSLEFARHRYVIQVDDQIRRPLIPLYSCHSFSIPLRSTIPILVSSPFSSASGYFIPSSVFRDYPALVASQKIVTIHKHRSTLLVTNVSDFPHQLPQDFCCGHLLSDTSKDPTFFDQVSVFCRRYNEKRNQQVLSSVFVHQQLPQRASFQHPTSAPSLSFHSGSSDSSVRSSISCSLQQTLNSLIKHLLIDSQAYTLLSLISQFSHLFDNSRHNMSNIVIENVFNTVPHTPPAFRPHRNPHHREETRKLIDEFLEAGIIQESKSSYAAPAFIVPRKDNRPGRLVVDYRALNRITIPDASPLPHREDLLQELGKGFKYFTKLDLKFGYHQFRIPAADRSKTAFVVSQGHYGFLVLAMGPQNAPAAFQKTMSTIMRPCRDFSLVFLDDLIVFSTSFDEHIQHLRLVFDTLSAARLVLNAGKCELAVTQVVVLGHKVSETSITPTTDAIQAILDLQEPRTLK